MTELIAKLTVVDGFGIYIGTINTLITKASDKGRFLARDLSFIKEEKLYLYTTLRRPTFTS